MQSDLELAARISRISVSSTMKVAAEADRLRREGFDVVDFGAGEPDFPTPDNIKEAAVRAIAANFTKYTPASGIMELREAVCERHREDYGTDYQPAECAITVGGKQAVFNLIQALVNQGDEVVIPIPYWVTYKDVVNYAGGVCRFVSTDERDGFRLTAAHIAPHLNAKTRVVIINSPSNPAGSVLSREEFEKIYRLTSSRGIWLLTDECYCRFLYEGEPFSVASFADARNHVLIAGSLSKTYSMTGWRVGFILAPTPVIGAVVKLASHSTSNPTSIAQKAAVEALRGPQDSVGVMLGEYRRRRDYVISRLSAMPKVTMAAPLGAFYAYPNISAALSGNGTGTPMQFAEKLLAQAHVAVVPGEAFGTDAHIRISYAASIEDLARGLDRIEAFIRSL